MRNPSREKIADGRTAQVALHFAYQLEVLRTTQGTRFWWVRHVTRVGLHGHHHRVAGPDNSEAKISGPLNEYRVSKGHSLFHWRQCDRGIPALRQL